MQPKTYFLDIWHEAMIICAIIMGAAGVAIYLFYKLRVSFITDYKEKYDFLNAQEIRWYTLVYLCFGIAFGFVINLYGMGKANLSTVSFWFFMRLVVGIAGATLVAYVSAIILKYYYPTLLNSKLQKWRYMPRINPKTQNRMKLLTEEEEDIHLDAGKQAEESIFSVDYDVWVDEKTGDIKIEKYWGHLVGLKCNNCGFYTMKVHREEVVEQYEDGSPKEILKHYQCAYCKNVRATQFGVSKRETDDYKAMKLKFKRNTRGIDMVRVEVHSKLTGKVSFEFQTIEQAEKFMSEFDIDKMARK